VRERPTDRALAQERARALSWSGAHSAAADALLETSPAPETEPDLVLELVDNLFWAERFIEADDSLEPLTRLRPDDVSLDSIRSRIRRSFDPSVEVATTWLERRDSPLERLVLARALARENRDAEALDHYRRASASVAAGDSLLLEIAAVAERADSLGLAASSLATYLASVPHDHATRMRVGRIHREAGAVELARHAYRAVIRETGDRTARFELAQLDAWSGRNDDARAALQQLLREDPDRSDVLRLLGDIARWDGDPQDAASYYRAALALDPHDPGLAAALSEAEQSPVSEAPALRLIRWTARSDAFQDTEGFRWLGSSAARSWHAGSSRVELSVQQELWAAERPPGQLDLGPGFGLEVSGETLLTTSLRLRLAAGARSYGSGFDFAAWLVEVAHSDVHGGTLELGYRREPAFRRAATAAALQAQATSDIGRITGGRSFGEWHAWSQLELERLGSSLGQTVRGSGVAALRRELGDGWAAYTTIGALAADRPSPLLPGWGPLYWAPASYTSVAAGGAFRSAFAPDWTLEVKLAPGYAWIDERDDEAARYGSNRAVTLSSGFEAAFARGSWSASIGGDWSAAHRGYRASALRLGIHFAPSSP
jgi:Flp pilus assembly protein TadD